MKKLKTLRIQEDLLARVEAIEPNFNKAAIVGLELFVGRQGNGGRADTRPARGRVGETGESRAAEVPRRAGSSPASPAKLEVASQAVSAIGEKVVPATALPVTRERKCPAGHPMMFRAWMTPSNFWCATCRYEERVK